MTSLDQQVAGWQVGSTDWRVSNCRGRRPAQLYRGHKRHWPGERRQAGSQTGHGFRLGVWRTVAAQIRCCAVWLSRLLTADGLAGVFCFLNRSLATWPRLIQSENPKSKVLSVVLLCSLAGSVAHDSFCGSSCIKGKYFHKLCKCVGGVGRSSLSSLNKLVQVHRE